MLRKDLTQILFALACGLIVATQYAAPTSMTGPEMATSERAAPVNRWID